MNLLRAVFNGFLLIWILSLLVALLGIQFNSLFAVVILALATWIIWTIVADKSSPKTEILENEAPKGRDDYVILVIDKTPILAFHVGNDKYMPVILNENPSPAMVSRSVVKDNLVNGGTYKLSEEMKLWVEKNIDP